jgi:hypothetical protein
MHINTDYHYISTDHEFVEDLVRSHLDYISSYTFINDYITLDDRLMFVKGWSLKELADIYKKRGTLPIAFMGYSEDFLFPKLTHDEIMTIVNSVEGSSYPKDTTVYYNVIHGSDADLHQHTTMAMINSYYKNN